ncbi:hypothetical protein Hanom_Chr04g00289111 [Helianthus anomalus]
MNGPRSLHFIMQLVPNLDMMKPLTCWLETICVTKCKPHEPFVYFGKANDQIQNFNWRWLVFESGLAGPISLTSKLVRHVV